MYGGRYEQSIGAGYVLPGTALTYLLTTGLSNILQLFFLQICYSIATSLVISRGTLNVKR